MLWFISPISFELLDRHCVCNHTVHEVSEKQPWRLEVNIYGNTRRHATYICTYTTIINMIWNYKVFNLTWMIQVINSCHQTGASLHKVCNVYTGFPTWAQKPDILGIYCWWNEYIGYSFTCNQILPRIFSICPKYRAVRCVMWNVTVIGWELFR